MGQFIILSGIPGSGKSTLGLQISSLLGYPVIDKDDILEAMFDSLGVSDSEWRERLSRSADEVLRRLVINFNNAIIISWWRHPKASAATGTPIDWISSLNKKITEVYCNCSSEEATKRFISRTRHKGHLDKLRGPNDLIPKFKQFSAYIIINL